MTYFVETISPAVNAPDETAPYTIAVKRSGGQRIALLKSWDQANALAQLLTAAEGFGA